VLDPSPEVVTLVPKSAILNLQSTSMDAARITELLCPFLHASVEHSTNVCRSEASPRPENSSERSRKPALSRSKGEAAALSPAQLHHISTYIDILLRWNVRINLTAIRDPEEIVTRHFGESLFAARHLFPDGQAVRNDPAALQGCVAGQKEMRALAPEALRVADIGSGAGFPGLPLKIWAPHIALTLIESNHKKATFLREVARALTFADVNIQNTRAETFAGTGFDVVTLRAVERFEAILPTAGRLVAPSGRLALLISSAQEDRARSTLPDLSWSAPVLIPYSSSRILMIGHR
jgi:16S rRNA (guanine527-N7)-methyltransferase